MDNLVYPLTEAPLSLAAAGGKGANLQRLAAAGLPVPPGFVLHTEAYRAFVAANDLAAVIEQAWAGTRATEPDSFERASVLIRERFEQGPMPSQLADALRAAYAGLGGGAVAVRSSATAEDLPEASFAGQQETYLNVSGEAALLEAVRRCWSSLWTARAMAYRHRQNLPPAAVALAVVVQRLVPAEAAGVLFTANPVNGDRDEVVINATWGLGEALVSGQVNPDTLSVDKATGRVKSVTVGDKQVMTAAAAQGTAEVAVAEARRTARVLDDARAEALAALARRIEAAFGAPQDIEWALAGGEFYILQSRPITGLAAGVPGDDAWPPLFTAEPQPHDHWTQTDVGERWPEPVTPFTWSLWRDMINENMRGSLAYLKQPYLLEGQWARRAYGRVYFNEGLLRQVFVREFGMPASLVDDSMGTQGKARSGWRWGAFIRRLPLFVAQGVAMNRDVGEFEKRFDQIDAWVEDFMARDLSAESDRALWAEASTLWRERMMSNMALHSSVTSASMMNFPMLEGMLGRWTGRKEAAYEVITGLTGVIQAEIVPSLNALAQSLRDLGLAGIVLENEPADALAQLRAAPAARPVLEQIESFLKRHGHRCPTEAEFRWPRWREQPEAVVQMLAGYLRNPAGQGATAQQRGQRERAAADIEARLNPAQRAMFRAMLARVQRLVRMRDNGQHFLVKLALPLRRLYAVLAERWAARGWLNGPDEFWFLVAPEVEAVLAAGDPARAGLDLPARAAARRLAYDYWFGVTAPEVLDADGRPVIPEAAGDSALAGVAASQGKVTGTARVVLNPREAGRLQPGDILVTRATDPGWTPVFSVISGVVLEIGGLLSHGAIVAREYGLPAVVNAADATRRIRDGQTVTVDGTAGRVYLE